MEDVLSYFFSKTLTVLVVLVSAMCLWSLAVLKGEKRFLKHGKIIALCLVNFLNYFIFTALKMVHLEPFSLENYFKNGVFVLSSLIVLVMGAYVNVYKESDSFYHGRHIYRGYFLVTIFLYPLFCLGTADLRLLCFFWFTSYLLSAFINRTFEGGLTEKAMNENGQVWLRTPNSDFFSDVLRFRSVFSINNPGSHRQTLENFYPYFTIFCVVIMIATTFFREADNNFALSTALTTVDGNALSGVISQVEHEDENVETAVMASEGSAAKDSTQKPQEQKPEEKKAPPSKKSNSLLNEVYRRNRPLERSSASALAEARLEPEARAVDMINVRNLIFVMLFLVSIWILNGKNINNSYVDKWKVLSEEMQNLLQIEHEKTVAARKLKILFACNLLTTEMWGHRSFSRKFKSILLEEKVKIKSGDAKKLLAFLQTRLDSLSQPES